MPSEREVEAAERAMGALPSGCPSVVLARAALSAAEGVRKEEGAALIAVLENPPEPNDALKKLLRTPSPWELSDNDVSRALWEQLVPLLKIPPPNEWTEKTARAAIATAVRHGDASLRALLAEAGAGLGPFKRAIEMAEGAFVHAEIGPTTSVLTAIATSYLHIEDFRRARALHAKIEKALGGGTRK